MEDRRQSYQVTAALRQFIMQSMDENDLNSREVAERSGGAISHSTVHALVKGSRLTVQYGSLQGLARALRIEVVALVQMTETYSPWTMPPEFDKVPPELRRRVERALRYLLSVGEKHDGEEP